jgi:type IV/VI secretion system ImpK/VasF family protein
MTLLELSDPLFKKICLLNRLGRKGAGPNSYEQLKLEIQDLFKKIGQTADKEPLLRAQWRKLELPLIFFADSMIAESRIPVAEQWHKNRLAYDQKELAGDEKFFDLLDETLNDPSDEATERLQVFYTCIGLGFMGWYATQPEYLRGKMIDISHRIQNAMETDRKARLCPEAYQYLDMRDLVQPPGSKVGAIAVIFAGLCLIVFAVEIYLFRAASISLTDSLSAISQQEVGK